MNIYKFQFEVECPNNKQRIAYLVEIRTTQTIMVENIAGYFLSFTEAYHEDIADQSYERFGGHQIIIAHHHGVDVRTERGAL